MQKFIVRQLNMTREREREREICRSSKIKANRERGLKQQVEQTERQKEREE